jgi:hypothetical protein
MTLPHSSRRQQHQSYGARPLRKCCDIADAQATITGDINDVQERAWADAVERGAVVAAVRFGAVGARRVAEIKARQGRGNRSSYLLQLAERGWGEEHEGAGREQTAVGDCQTGEHGERAVLCRCTVCRQRCVHWGRIAQRRCWRPY